MAQQSKRTCPKCNGVLIPNASYCPRCGSRIFQSADGNVSADPYIGTVIDNTFEVKSILGTGSMGIVYRAFHRALNCDIALKVLRHDYLTDRIVLTRFQREAQAASALSHPNIIQIMHFGKTQIGAPYIAMECLSGLELASLVSEQFPLAPRRTCRIASQIAHALAAAHRANIIHRDLKPANIIIVNTDHGETVKVLDFGIAKIADVEGEGLTRDGSICGTPAFMSPEQILGKKITPASDIFSFGSTLYFMLTCRLPFHGDSLVEISKSLLTANPTPPSQARIDCYVDPALEAVCIKALQKSPADRYQSAQELADTLDSIYDRLPEGIPNVKPKIVVAPTLDDEDLSGETRSVEAFEDNDDEEEGTVVEMSAFHDNSSEMTRLAETQKPGGKVSLAISQILNTIAPPKDEDADLSEHDIYTDSEQLIRTRKRLLLGLICIISGVCLIGTIIVLIISYASQPDIPEVTHISESEPAADDTEKKADDAEKQLNPVEIALITDRVIEAGSRTARNALVFGIYDWNGDDASGNDRDGADDGNSEADSAADETGKEKTAAHERKIERDKQIKARPAVQKPPKRPSSGRSAGKTGKSSPLDKKLREAEMLEDKGEKIKACSIYRKLLKTPDLAQKDKLKLQAKVRGCSRISI